jgi:hypothetical protein
VHPIGHRLHLASTLDDLGVYVWPAPLDVGDTRTLASGERCRVVATVEVEVADREVDRLLEVVSVRLDRASGCRIRACLQRARATRSYSIPSLVARDSR